ncbi:hypothetical protein [Methylibium sp. Pch-M]|uniref:hypothetical protein n=1 Tax=Methylibium sp. Pch-M TaxID=2082386 RepID=UPI0013EA893A|nr:hypothetical protein [Methylibium sp. Pch-M]
MTPQNLRNEREANMEGFEGTPLELESLDAEDRRFIRRVAIGIALVLAAGLVMVVRGCA